MSPIIVVVFNPFVQLFLQRFHLGIHIFSKGHLVKLLQNSFMESLADAIRLRMPGFCLSMFNIIERKIQLVIVLFCLTAILRSTIREHPQQRELVLLKERKHFVIEHVSRRNWCLGRVEFG